MKRKLVILTVIALAVLGGGYGTETAQAKTFKSSADAMYVIKWQQKQVKIQKQIVRTKQMWISTGPYVAYLHILNEKDVAAHLHYISLLHQRIQGNLKTWNALKLREKKAANPYYGLGLPPHAAGWICIHNREGAWNDQTGNGFFGGLQMTYGWMGVLQNAALLTPAAQMWAAEKVAAENHFSYSWMHGQWPNTFPPCAGYF